MRFLRASVIAIALLLTASLQGAVLTKNPNTALTFGVLLTGPGLTDRCTFCGQPAVGNSFIAPDGGTVSSLGIWLARATTPASLDFKLKVMGSRPGSQVGLPSVDSVPDPLAIIATTATITGPSLPFATLAFVSAPTISSTNLTAGQRYWLVAVTDESPDGQRRPGAYFMADHIPNSEGIVDNGQAIGSFYVQNTWYFGAPTTVEFAFQVTTGSAVPEPSTVGLVGFGLLASACYRRRTRSTEL